MADSAVDPAVPEEFFRRRETSAVSERANYAMFFSKGSGIDFSQP